MIYQLQYQSLIKLKINYIFFQILEQNPRTRPLSRSLSLRIIYTCMLLLLVTRLRIRAHQSAFFFCNKQGLQASTLKLMQAYMTIEHFDVASEKFCQQIKVADDTYGSACSCDITRITINTIMRARRGRCFRGKVGSVQYLLSRVISYQSSV